MTISSCQRCRFSNRALVRIACVSLMIAGLSGCRRGAVHDRAPASLTLTSGSFRQGENIPSQFTCSGANISPAISWNALPPDTKSLALLVTDPDSLFGAYVHWIVYNVPPEPKHIAEGVPRTEELPNGAKQGMNSDDGIGYTGPCPPGNSVHRYVFTLYALDAMLNPPSPVTKENLMKTMEGHILASGQLVGRYHR